MDSFITLIEREDIESLGSALYKIPKQVEKSADRYSLAPQHLEHIVLGLNARPVSGSR